MYCADRFETRPRALLSFYSFPFCRLGVSPCDCSCTIFANPFARRALHTQVGAGHRTNVYTNADSTYATVVQICWFVMAVQSVAQVAIYLCSPRVCRRFAGVSLSDVWNRRHGGDQQRSGSAEREPLLQSQSGAASSSIQEPLSREWATPSPPLSSVRTDDYSLSMEGAVGFVPWELGTSPKKQ